MLNKTTSVFLVLCLLAITNQFVFGQVQFYKTDNFPQSDTISKREFLDKLGVNNRAEELLDKDSFVKVKKDSITSKAMQDADKAQQKKFVGINTTTAIVIGAAIAAAIIIVLATKGGSEKPRGPIECVGIRFPCP